MFVLKFKDAVRNNLFTVIAICLCAVMSGVTFRFSVPAAVAELAAVVIVVILAIKRYSDITGQKLREVKALSKALNTSGKECGELTTLPLAVVLTDKSGSIIWFNSVFEEYIPDLEARNKKNLSDIFADIAEKNDINGSVPFEFSGAEKKFTVYPSQPDESIYAYYFAEDTGLKKIRKRFELTRPVVLLVNIDSLEQAEDIMPHEDYYGLNSDIDRLVTKWFVENNCVFRKFGDGKFFALTEYSNLAAMTANRFGIIDKVREGHFGSDEVDITLSIGVGHEDDFRASEDSAREALDMARGRGGDQAAVKNGDSYEFFGGISTGREKRGKVKTRAFAAALDGYIETSSDVLVMGHSFGDFDCVGSAAGIVAIARAKGKNARVVVNKKTTMAAPMIKMLESGTGAISFISPEEASDFVNEKTLLVITDTMRMKIVEAPALVELGLRTVIIDHHRMSVDHIAGKTFELLEPHASSACEMVTELVQYSPSKPKLTIHQAQALLAGIMLDTKDYTLRVSMRTFEAASYLKYCKADTVAVKKLFAGSADENIQVNNTVNSAVYYDRYAISVCAEQSSSARLVASKAADELLSIDGVDASFVISRNGDGINISARSLERINVQLIMEKLGGGGHHSMAAAQLKEVTAEQAFVLLQQTVDDYLKSL